MKRTAIAVLVMVSLAAMLLTGCAQENALPEWAPENCGSYRVDTLSVTLLTNGEQSELQAQYQLWSEQTGRQTYRYNPRDGLRQEEASGGRQPGAFTLEEMLPVLEDVTAWVQKNVPASGDGFSITYHEPDFVRSFGENVRSSSKAPYVYSVKSRTFTALEGDTQTGETYGLLSIGLFVQGDQPDIFLTE